MFTKHTIGTFLYAKLLNYSELFWILKKSCHKSYVSSLFLVSMLHVSYHKACVSHTHFLDLFEDALYTFPWFLISVAKIHILFVFHQQKQEKIKKIKTFLAILFLSPCYPYAYERSPPRYCSCCNWIMFFICSRNVCGFITSRHPHTSVSDLAVHGLVLVIVSPDLRYASRDLTVGWACSRWAIQTCLIALAKSQTSWIYM